MKMEPEKNNVTPIPYRSFFSELGNQNLSDEIKTETQAQWHLVSASLIYAFLPGQA